MSLISLNRSQIYVGWGEKIYSERPLSYPAWYFPDFFLETKNSYFTHPHHLIISPEKFLSKIPNIFSSKKFFWTSRDWSIYEKQFHYLKFLFEKKALVKAVPYVRFIASDLIDQASLMQSLIHALKYHISHPKTSLIGTWNNTEGFFGVTPEILCRMENSQLKTMACAGTMPSAEAMTLNSDPKLQQEHAAVIDGLLADLSPFGKPTIGKTEVRSFGKLAHLVTPITLNMPATSTVDKMIALLHPTAALGAWPKKRGSEFLKDYADLVPRKHYGSPAGIFLSPHEGVILVAIRAIEWNFQALMIYTGGGVIKNSILHEEKNELMLKLAAIQEQLNV